jgi:hypothetical protein
MPTARLIIGHALLLDGLLTSSDPEHPTTKHRQFNHAQDVSTAVDHRPRAERLRILWKGHGRWTSSYEPYAKPALKLWQQITYAKTKTGTIAKLDGSYKMPEPEREAGRLIQYAQIRHWQFNHAQAVSTGSYKMPEPEREAEAETEQTTAQAADFGAAPAKAVPVNAPDAAKGQKMGRGEEEEEEQDDAEMEIEAKNFDGWDDEAKPPQVQHSDWSLIEFIDMLLDTDLTAFLWIAGFFSWTDTDDFKML